MSNSNYSNFFKKNTTKVQIKKLENARDLKLPFYATPGSAGLDLQAALSENMILMPGDRCLVPCGFALALPIGFEAQIRPRSGLALKFGVTVLNTPGTGDSDYRGEYKVILINHGKKDFIIEPGMRIAQMIISKYEHVFFEDVVEFEESIDKTFRGEKGFGSTGL